MADESAEQGGARRGRRTSIPCPKCGARKSYSAGGNGDDKRIYRRRKCAGCGERFSAYEVSAADYKRLCQMYDVEGYRKRLEEHERQREAKADELAGAFKYVMDMLNRERAQIEEERQWQRDNPTEALKTILPMPVFEYLNEWARRENKPLIQLMAERLTADAEIDIDCSRGERPDYELDRWQEKLMPHTVMYREPPPSR